MQFISTRGGIEPVSFKDCVMMGLATDGGLLLPGDIPDVRDRLEAWRDLAYADLAREILGLYADDVPAADLERLVRRSYASFAHPEIAPVVPLGDLFVQELYHGPTLAFKDLALQFLGNLFEYILEERQASLNILAATSGDTGSAAICGVRGKERMHIFVLHPHERVSPVQERQMTSVLDANVHNIAVEGNFDDCQAIIKALFNELDFKQHRCLGAVNSVNLARVLAQIVYYFYGAFRVQEQTGAEKVNFCVPTGTFGNIFAGWMALQMGAPIDKLILATNENDILARFFETGIYRRGALHATLSPSMDIQIASNFERYLFYRCNADAEKLRAAMTQFADSGELRVDSPSDPVFLAGTGDTEAVLGVIRDCYEGHGYVLDPHSAVGVAVARKFHTEDAPTICLATAHPAKFSEAVARAVGSNVAQHPAIDALAERPTRCTVLPNKIDAIRDFVAAALDG